MGRLFMREPGTLSKCATKKPISYFPIFQSSGKKSKRRSL